MSSAAKTRRTFSVPPGPGRTSSTVLERMFRLGCTTSGEYKEAAGQAKYLARFVLAAARELDALSKVSG